MSKFINVELIEETLVETRQLIREYFNDGYTVPYMTDIGVHQKCQVCQRPQGDAGHTPNCEIGKKLALIDAVIEEMNETASA